MSNLKEQCRALGINDGLADELVSVARNDMAVFTALSHPGPEELPARLAVAVVALSQLNTERLNKQLEQMRRQPTREFRAGEDIKRGDFVYRQADGTMRPAIPRHDDPATPQVDVATRDVRRGEKIQITRSPDGQLSSEAIDFEALEPKDAT